MHEGSVRHRGPRPQADVLGPRRDDESLDKDTVFPQVAKDAPTDGPIAAPYGLDGMDGAEKRFTMLDIEPVLDLNQDRTVLRTGLDRKGQFRQLRPRSD